MSYKVVFATYKNMGYQFIGLVLVALGIIGIVLPVMPTTIFFILALGCFTRSSPKLAAWLLNHPRYGATLRHWQNHKVVPIKAKWFAGMGMLAGFVLLFFTHPSGWVLYTVALVEVAVMIYLLSRPSCIHQAQSTHLQRREVKLLALFMAIFIHAIVIIIIMYQPSIGPVLN